VWTRKLDQIARQKTKPTFGRFFQFQDEPMKILITVLTVGTCALITTASRAQLLTFDNLATNYDSQFRIYRNAVPNGYGGLLWNNFWALDVVNSQPVYAGLRAGLVSPNDDIFNYGGLSATISSSGLFNLNSAYLTADLNDGLQVEVQGFLGTTLLYDNTYTVSPNSPTFVNFNYVGVNSVTFSASGGTPDPTWSPPNIGNSVFALDNMSVTVPEPSSLSLTFTAALLAVARKKIRW
jgi:hypothetical protein